LVKIKENNAREHARAQFISPVHSDVTHLLLDMSGHGIGMDNGETAWVYGPFKDFLESVK
jgi:hypothetical protein